LKYLKFLTQAAIKNYTITKDDVFIQCWNDRTNSTIPEILDGANLTENAAKITSLKNVYNKFLSLFLSSQHGQRQIQQRTMLQPSQNFHFSGLNNRTASPTDRRATKIVSKIEELFSELDKGIEELKTAQQQLKVYRQAVLKSAFEGMLTNEM
jgi:type I restriction enzyme S subunit